MERLQSNDLRSRRRYLEDSHGLLKLIDDILVLPLPLAISENVELRWSRSLLQLTWDAHVGPHPVNGLSMDEGVGQFHAAKIAISSVFFFIHLSSSKSTPHINADKKQRKHKDEN